MKRKYKIARLKASIEKAMRVQGTHKKQEYVRLSHFQRTETEGFNRPAKEDVASCAGA